jgi:hypothetical protein
MKCAQCGAEHNDLQLQPSFQRPDVVFALDPASRASLVLKESDDLCVMKDGTRLRCFVRCILPVRVHGYQPGTAWGFWVETGEAAFVEMVDTWQVEDQSHIRPFEAAIANQSRMYPGTLGLPVRLQPVSASARPRIHFKPGVNHPLAVHAEEGVSIHLASQWGATPP